MIARASSILILAGVLAVSVPEFTAGQTAEVDRKFGGNGTHFTSSTPSTHLTPSTPSARRHGHAGKHKPAPTSPPVAPLPPGDPVYTPPNNTTSNTVWSAGTNWSPGAPTSGATTQLTYNGGTPYKNVINTNTDDIGAAGSAFSLNILDLSGNGDTSGGGSSITIAASGGRSLNFVSNGATTPVINLTGNTGGPGHGMTYTVSAPITLTNNTLFTGNGTATFNFSGAISGSASLTKSGTSLLTLSGANTYTGATIVNGGTLQAGVATVGTTSGAFGVNSAVTLANTAGATLDLNSFNNTIGSLTGGGATGGNVTVGSATLTVGSDNTSPGAYAGVISGTGGLTKIGTGTLTLSGANSYTGLTTVTAGTLAEGASNALSTGALTVNGSTAVFDLGANHSDSVGTVILDGGGSITGTGTSTLTSTGSFDMRSGTASAILAGSGIALTKTTSGTVTLTGANTYTGATTVNAGTLLVNGSTASGSAVTVNNSGTVLGGTGTINGTVNVNANAIINPGPQGTAGTAASVGTLTTGALTLVSTATFHGDASGTLASNWDKLVVNGTATLGSSTLQLIIASGLTFTPNTVYTLIDATTISGTFNGIADNSLQTFSGYEFIAHYNLGGDGNFELTAVPEPSTWVAGALALAAVGYTQRRRFVRALERARA
jgi:autotransporter-associated beta strand protein